jgi:hypothetical protein
MGRALWAGQPDMSITHLQGSCGYAPRLADYIDQCALYFFNRQFDEAIPDGRLGDARAVVIQLLVGHLARTSV